MKINKLSHCENDSYDCVTTYVPITSLHSYVYHAIVIIRNTHRGEDLRGAVLPLQKIFIYILL